MLGEGRGRRRREGRRGKRVGDDRGGEGKGRGGLSGNVAEEAFCLKSATGRCPLPIFPPSWRADETVI